MSPVQALNLQAQHRSGHVRAQSIPAQPLFASSVEAPSPWPRPQAKAQTRHCFLAPEQPSKPSQARCRRCWETRARDWTLEAKRIRASLLGKPLDLNWRYRCSAGQKTASPETHTGLFWVRTVGTQLNPFDSVQGQSKCYPPTLMSPNQQRVLCPVLSLNGSVPHVAFVTMYRCTQVSLYSCAKVGLCIVVSFVASDADLIPAGGVPPC